MDSLYYVVDRHFAIRIFANGSKSRARNNGVVCRLIVRDVPLGGGDDLSATRDVRHHAYKVPHRPRGHKETRLLTEQIGGALLQFSDGGVVLKDVVAHLSARHCAAHLRGRVGHGV